MTLEESIENKKINVATARPGRKILKNEIPADLMLESSYRSAISPNTITLLKSTVSGNAIGIEANAKYQISSI